MKILKFVNHLEIQKSVLVLCLFFSGCAFNNFKIKFDDPQDEQFSKKIISIENTVKTTPVEFASSYNNYAPTVAHMSTEGLPMTNTIATKAPAQEQFNQALVQQAKPELAPHAETLVEAKQKTLVQSDLTKTDELESLMATKSKIKVLKSKRKGITKRAYSSLNNPFEDNSAPSESMSSRKGGQYVVKKGDTLMKISFAQYGNVYKWKKIMEDNKGKISDYRKLKAGTELRIEGDMYVVVERNGHPYLIKKNDTLLRISNKVYGDARKWPLLWKNNKQLIHDPNKIYAGFTLYYLDLEDMKLKKADFKPDESERKPTSE